MQTLWNKFGNDNLIRDSRIYCCVLKFLTFIINIMEV